MVNNLPKNEGRNELDFIFLTTSKCMIFELYGSYFVDYFNGMYRSLRTAHQWKCHTLNLFWTCRQTNVSNGQRKRIINTSAAIYERIDTVSSPFTEHFLSHSSRNQWLKTFFVSFSAFFYRLFGNSCMQHTHYTYASKLPDCLNCTTTEVVIVLRLRWSYSHIEPKKQTDR